MQSICVCACLNYFYVSAVFPKKGRNVEIEAKTGMAAGSLISTLHLQIQKCREKPGLLISIGQARCFYTFYTPLIQPRSVFPFRTFYAMIFKSGNDFNKTGNENATLGVMLPVTQDVTLSVTQNVTVPVTHTVTHHGNPHGYWFRRQP